MKRKLETKTVHVTEPCDEWLSTRNKQKIRPPSPKPTRRKSHISRGFSRQTSSSLYHLTQSAPPHPLLFTATKQSSIQGFFKPVQNQNNIGNEQSGERYKESTDDVEEIKDSEEECNSTSVDTQFEPVWSSTQRMTSKQAIRYPTYDREGNLSPLMKAKSLPREATLVGLTDTGGSRPLSDELSPGIDFSHAEPREPVNSQESVFSVGKTAQQSSNLSIFRDSDSNKSFDINENSISFYKNQKSPALDSRSPDVLADSLVFTEDGTSDAGLLGNIRNRKSLNYVNPSATVALKHISRDNSVHFIDNSLTFTESEYDTCDRTQSHESQRRLSTCESLVEDDVTDSFSEILRKIRERRVNRNDMTLAANGKQTIDKEMLRNTKRQQSCVMSPNSSHEEDKCASKTRPLISATEDEVTVSVDLRPCAKRFRTSSLQNKSHVEQSDLYLKSVEHPTSRPARSEDVISFDLSPSKLNPTGARTMRSASHRQPYWRSRLSQDSKYSYGNDKQVPKRLKIEKFTEPKDSKSVDGKSQDGLFFGDESFLETEKLTTGHEFTSTDIDNSLRFTNTQGETNSNRKLTTETDFTLESQLL